MFSSRIIVALAASAALFTGVYAEQHTVTFVNNCGFGTPLLKSNGQTLSTGQTVTFGGPLISAIAFLQTGGCGDNGEGCTLIETTLRNPTSPGSGSSTDISLIPPHEFSVTSGFGYYGGCEPAGADCTYNGCPDAFYNPYQTGVQVACQVDNVNLAITFCD
ncbi:glycopeptide [Phanerochaete sordida]|uniref:Glycopeptide n=1 Tax=Phanerochaete sordida TaxID=48140 RepID=A0A9P3GKM1_9APHY|nr:glycopeptide [Phanerochaete sordida]